VVRSSGTGRHRRTVASLAAAALGIGMAGAVAPVAQATVPGAASRPVASGTVPTGLAPTGLADRLMAATFTDVPDSHPFATEIEWLVDVGIAQGYPDGTFRPGVAISRDAMAAFLYRDAGEPVIADPTTPPFSDVPLDHPFVTEIAWLKAAGLTTGYSDGTYRPSAPIARDAMAAFLYRAQGSPTFDAPAWSTFPDVPTTHAFFDEIEWLADQGVTGGYVDGSFQPAGPVNRDAMAAFMYRSHPVGGKIVGTGTPGSCTSSALALAVRSGGDITFDCGPDPVTIVVSQTLYTCNTTTCQHGWEGAEPVDHMTLDGGGTVTLSGGGVRGIFYANSCEEAFGWLSSRCDLETRPHITFRDISFTAGNAQGAPAGFTGVGGGEGGGAIAMRGGRLTLSRVSFIDNVCIQQQSDGGGGAVRVVGQVTTARIFSSVFQGNQCANGGAISSLHASVRVVDSHILANTATGIGASSGNGGNGGGIYFDGTNESVLVQGTTITGNAAPEGGSGIFYVSNDHSGTLTIEGSTITSNTGETFWTDPYHDIYYLGFGPIRVSTSTID